MSAQSDFKAIVLYDGYCVLCNWFVRFVLRIDQTGIIGFASLDSPIARELHDRIPPEIDSVVLLVGEHTYVRSEAIFRVIAVVGGFWKVLRVFQVFPVGLTDAVYDWVARRRKKIIGAYDACPVPEEKYRWRFLG